MQTINVVGAFFSNYTIPNLMPYTQYKLNIAGYSANGRGPLSEDCTFTTLESSPSPPRNLAYHSITNSSVVLTWEPPEHLNGGLTSYKVWYNSTSTEVRKPENAHKNITYTLSNLQSYETYEIVVVACTKSYSNKSNSILIRTEIGKPGDVIKNSDSTRNVFKWNAPVNRGGSLNYYELISKFGNNRTVYINGNVTTCTLRMKICDGTSDQHEFLIRAVNILFTPHSKHRSKRNLLSYQDDELFVDDIVHHRHRRDIDNEQKICEEQDDSIPMRMIETDKHAIYFYGNWTEIDKTTCRFQSTSLLSLYVVLSLFISMAMAYAIFLIMKKIKKMKDIGVKLPEGLEGIIQDGKDNGKNNGVNLNCNIGRMTNNGIISGDTNRADNLFISREQEQTLLKKNRSESGSTSSSTENNSHCEDNEAIDSESEVI